MRSPRRAHEPTASPLGKLKSGVDSSLAFRSVSLPSLDAIAVDMENAAPRAAESPKLSRLHLALLQLKLKLFPTLPHGGSLQLFFRFFIMLRPLLALLRAVCTPSALALLVLALAAPSWWGSIERLPKPAPSARGIPVLAIPMSARRGATLLSTLSALDVRVDTLLLCDSAPGAPELECVAGEVAARVARGELPVGEVRVVRPAAGLNGGSAGPVYGVSECWNALARGAFGMEEARAPWMLLMNDDVGFSEGTLGLSVAAAWEAYKGRSLLLANDALPGVGYAFSAYVLTREGYAALGPFDENFYPAYYEVRNSAPLAAPPLPLSNIPSSHHHHHHHQYHHHHQ